MTTGWSTLLTTKLLNVMFCTMPLPTFWPAQALIRAPFCASLILILLMRLSLNGRFDKEKNDLTERSHSVRCRTFPGIAPVTYRNDLYPKRTWILVYIPNRDSTRRMLEQRYNLHSMIEYPLGTGTIKIFDKHISGIFFRRFAHQTTKRYTFYAKSSLGLNATQSSPLTITEFLMVTSLLLYTFHPSVLAGLWDEFDTAVMRILLYTTPLASFIWRRMRLFSSGTYIQDNDTHKVGPFGTIDHCDILNEYICCLEDSQGDGT